MGALYVIFVNYSGLTLKYSSKIYHIHEMLNICGWCISISYLISDVPIFSY